MGSCNSAGLRPLLMAVPSPDTSVLPRTHCDAAPTDAHALARHRRWCIECISLERDPQICDRSAEVESPVERDAPMGDRSAEAESPVDDAFASGLPAVHVNGHSASPAGDPPPDPDPATRWSVPQPAAPPAPATASDLPPLLVPSAGAVAEPRRFRLARPSRRATLGVGAAVCLIATLVLAFLLFAQDPPRSTPVRDAALDNRVPTPIPQRPRPEQNRSTASPRREPARRAMPKREPRAKRRRAPSRRGAGSPRSTSAPAAAPFPAAPLAPVAPAATPPALPPPPATSKATTVRETTTDDPKPTRSTAPGRQPPG
jgi:hypothetical protein